MISELNHDQTCPRCQQQVSVSAMIDGFVACNHCGWSPVPAKSDNNKRALIGLSGFAAAFIVGLIHVTNWSEYSLSIIPLKAKQFIGLSTAPDLREIANICTSQLKHDCVEAALADISPVEATPDDTLRLSDLRRKIGKNIEAISSYKELLSKKDNLDTGRVADINYGIAKSYENLNRPNDAIEFYELAIAAKPEVIQITVTESYLKLLEQLGQTDSIKKVITEARRRGGSERLFSTILLSDGSR